MATPSTHQQIQPAELLSVNIWKGSNGLESPNWWILEAKFRVSLTHEHPKAPPPLANFSIILNAKVIMPQSKEKQSGISCGELRDFISHKTSARVFLCGGPGDENRPDRNAAFNNWYTQRPDPETLIFLDYRGTGRSVDIHNSTNVIDPEYQKYMRLLRPQDHPTNTDTELTQIGVDKMAELLTLFRQDNIVRDLEAIRKCLLVSEARHNKWHIFGQSYGGWVSLSYLSLYPEGLLTSTITAGLAPMSKPVEVYDKLFAVVIARNDMYYAQYPDDIKRVKAIVRYLSLSPPGDSRLSAMPLPSGGFLDPRRFLCLGRNLGNRKRWAELHRLIESMDCDISKTGHISPASLAIYEQADTWRLDKRPLYALLHEPMYCGVNEASNWAAEQAARKLPQYKWAVSRDTNWREALLELCESKDGKKIYFMGEAILPFMYSQYRSLIPLRGVADALAKHVWTPNCYHDQLKRNTLPVISIGYASDMHVSPELSLETAGLVKGIVHEILDVEDGQLLEHGSLRNHAGLVLGRVRELTTLWHNRYSRSSVSQDTEK